MNHGLRTAGVIVYTSITTLGFVAAVMAVYFVEIPATQRDYALILLGALISGFRDVGSYFTGSTASSQQKDATIQDLSKKP